ncbi:MAG: metallophosphoesterase [Polyangiaceae bacterium]
MAVDANSAVVRWEGCRQDGVPEVRLIDDAGGAPTVFTSKATAVERKETYTAPLRPELAADLAGTYWIYEARLTSLAAATCYRYELVADPGRQGKVCTARPSGAPFRFVAIGDTNPGLGETSARLVAQLPRVGADFVVHGGDIQYFASGLDTWASWFDTMQPMLSLGAFYPAIGNHESEVPDEREKYVQPFFGGAGFPSNSTYYSFDTAGVWFFALDSEEPLALGSAQYVWFAKSLAAAAASPGYRFSVVYFHKPWVTCGDTSENSDARGQFEPLFTKHGVLLVIQAHMHGYERFELGALTYVTSGGGGGLLGNVDENVGRPTCAMRAASGPHHHLVVFDVGRRALSAQVLGVDKRLLDSFSKAVPGPPGDGP